LALGLRSVRLSPRPKITVPGPIYSFLVPDPGTWQ
jgi:hypothetical protein